MNTLEQLINNLSRLPGIGRKSASRIAYHLLKADRSFVDTVAREIAEIKDRIKVCSMCGNYTEEDPCPICTDPRRDHGIVCVLEQSQDVATIEATNEYRGVYHVLMGVLSPLNGVGPENLNIASLLHRVGQGGVREVIIATNPTVEGDTTGLYLVRLLKETGVVVSRLASGLPVGGDLEYADRLTLARSIKGRTPLSL